MWQKWKLKCRRSPEVMDSPARSLARARLMRAGAGGCRVSISMLTGLGSMG